MFLLPAALCTSACDRDLVCRRDESRLELTREDSGVDATLRAVAIDPGDSERAVAVGDAGTIVTRDRSGWTVRDGGEQRWNDVAFASDGAALVVGAGGSIARSLDGETWMSLPPVTTADLHQVVADTGVTDRWVAVGDGTILFATGTDVAEVDLPSGVGALRGLATDFEGGFLAVGLDGQVLRSADGGLDWSFVAASGPVDFLAVAYAPEEGSEPWLLLGGDGKLYRDPGGAEVDYEILGDDKPLALSSPLLAGEQGWVYMLLPSEDITMIGSRQSDIGALRGVAWGYSMHLAVGDAGAIVSARLQGGACL
jgi:photosystem II stability/assembly factor-like uncharacterized protein